SAAARPTSGCEPAPRPSVTCTPIWMMRSAFDMVSAWASVLATTNSTPCRPAVVMLLAALPPAPPTPKTVMRGLSSRMSGIFKLMVIGASSLRGRGDRRRVRPVRHRPRGSGFVGSSEALAKPSSDPCDISGPCHQLPRMPRFEMFVVCRLGVDKQAGGDAERRTLGRFMQPRDAERTADADRTAQDARGQLRGPGE